MNCSPSLSVSRTPRCTHLHHSLQTWKRHCQNLAPFLSASLKKPLVYAETSPIVPHFLGQSRFGLQRAFKSSYI
ncbi:hypothetical protein SDJN03_11869, partial [Cucurbita argyrosperma subsp. sororia]